MLDDHMARETPERTKQEPESEQPAAVRRKKSFGTLPKGGMSPLADRADPGAWTAPKAPLDAREVRIAPRDDRGKTAPEQPVGGWVDMSKGRRPIRGSGAPVDRKQRPRESRQERMVALKDKEYPDMAPYSTSTRRRASVKIRLGKGQAAAEAAAKERQEEDRNYQDAVKDMMADDEGYDDGDS